MAKGDIMETKCTWARAFDGNFNLSCNEGTHMRGSGHFKGTGKWEFNYCPYCGGKIELEENNATVKRYSVFTPKGI